MPYTNNREYSEQLNLGMYAVTNALTFGAWYRNNLSARPDAIIGMIGYSTPFMQPP